MASLRVGCKFGGRFFSLYKAPQGWGLSSLTRVLECCLVFGLNFRCCGPEGVADGNIKDGC